MTNEQLRKIDALIAEHVMELGIIFTDRIYAEKYDWFLERSFDLVPAYSTDIAAAWEVARKLADEMYYKGDDSEPLAYFAIRKIGDKWQAGLYEVFSDEEFYVAGKSAIHESESLAICLAALKAKGVEIDVN